MTSTRFVEGQLKALVERIERLEEEKKTIAADIKEVYAEAKDNGFDVKILRKIISIRKMEAEERQEQEAMIDLYMSALGMQPSLFEEEIPETDSHVDADKSLSANDVSQEHTSEVVVSTTVQIPIKNTIQQPPSVPTIDAAVDQGEVAHTASPVQIEEPELPDVPAFMDRRKPKPVYTPEQLLASG